MVLAILHQILEHFYLFQIISSRKFKQLGHSVGSFVVNTSVGILGFLNPAEKMGLKPHKEDVGQTLGSYGLDLVVILFFQY